MRRSSPSTDTLRVARARAAGVLRGRCRASGRGTADDEGSASLEFIVGGVLLLAPILYLMLALGAIQGQSLGVEAAARHTARAVSTATDSADAAARADRVLASVIAEYGMDPAGVTVRWDCAGDAATCPAAGATLVVTVAARVALPLVPPILGMDEIAAVPVEATAAQKVSRFWGAAL